jgi:quercetin dioxygenase-like cupin family protein
MRPTQLSIGIVLALSVAVGVRGGRMLSAQDPLKSGKILQRTELTGAKGMEAILVLRELPPGGESGKHTQSGNEIVYILEGSVILEVQGKAPVTLKAGEAFQTAAGEVHNVKNANASAPGKALAFYVAKKGSSLENLSVPAK